jgi:DNA invertase Pin-like site-specific DNA recombinase
MRVGYARVSTQDQNPDLQIDALKAAGCKKIFVEKASGAQRDRPELQAALEYMRDHGDDVMVCWKLDRLARSLRQLIETVEDLEKRGIGFESLTERIDTSSAAGCLTFHIFACMAQFERSINRERTRAALEASRARGLKGGRPPSMSAKDVTHAKALLADPDITVEEVAKRMNVAASTLYRHLPGGRSSVVAS